MSISNFGEQFAAKVLRKFFQSAVTPAITNTNYEGEIKKAGDRVNILSFLSNIALGDYTAGSDMSTQALTDTEDTLTVSQRKYYNFPIDRLEDLFIYADDMASALVDNASKALEQEVDKFVLGNAGEVKAGNWVGVNLRVAGGGATAGTSVSIVTTATGATLTTMADDEGATDTSGSSSHGFENSEDGELYWTGFDAYDVGKPVRLTSGKTWATPWYLITAVTDSNVCSITNWDGATAGVGDIPTGDILRGLGGGSGDDERTYEQNRDDKPIEVGTSTGVHSGWGWEFQAGAVTQITASNVYEAITLVAEKLDRNEIPDSDRHLTVPPQMMAILRQASELQPAIAMAYEGVVLNGRVGRVAGFDIHMASGARVSTRVGHTMALSSTQREGASFVGKAGTTGFQILANHISFCTFANKWSETRTIDAEAQFAKKYQGLFLYGAKVPALRRSAGACLFATF